MTIEPTTEAGREMLKDQQAGITSRPIYPIREHICAIEAQARADANFHCAGCDGHDVDNPALEVTP